MLCEKCRSQIKEISGTICNYCGSPLTVKNSNDSSVSSDSVSPSLNSNYFSEKNKESSLVFKIRSESLSKNFCLNCRNSEYSFYRLRSFGIYCGILKKLIIKYKYNKIYSLAPVLCGFLKKTFNAFYQNEQIDYIDTVSDFIFNTDDFEKNFNYEKNHMQLLAQLFSKEVKLPYFNNIIKIRKTLKQHNLGRHERQINLKNTFKTANVLRTINKNILIIDDVWTTGSTLNEISGVLKKCGADKIYLLTLARAT